MKIADIDIPSLIISGINHKDHPDYVDAYYSYGEFNNGMTMTDDELEQFKDTYPAFFYEQLTNTIY